MSEVLGAILWLLVALGLLITFHEFGHFWVARRLGVRVLRFSIGFGRPLWLRRGADGVEYVVAMIPLGGYVKMLDEREADVPEELKPQALTASRSRSASRSCSPAPYSISHSRCSHSGSCSWSAFPNPGP